MTLNDIEIITRVLAELAIIVGGFGFYFIRRTP
jgi:hypothetical protein